MNHKSVDRPNDLNGNQAKQTSDIANSQNSEAPFFLCSRKTIVKTNSGYLIHKVPGKN